jgi:hypothetical protein
MNIFYAFGWKFMWETNPQNNLHVRKTTQPKRTHKYPRDSDGIQTGVQNTTAEENSLKK